MTTPAPTGTDPRKPIRTLYNIHQRAQLALRDSWEDVGELRRALHDIRWMTGRYRDHWEKP